MEIEKELPGLKENIPLAKYTTFRIGGRAKYFYIAQTKEDLIKAIKVAKNFDLPFFILGGGSNLLISDKGYRGLVIKCQMSNVKCQNLKLESKILIAEAGARLSDLVTLSINKSLAGLEWAAGIPGTIGGAVYGNAGWPSDKKNISAVIESVEVLETKPGFKIKKYKQKDCIFEYRDSIFKHNKSLIILGAFLKLKKGKKENIKRQIAKILKTRKGKIPPGFSAGSVFKNPPKYSAGKLIEKCGLKGKKIGGAVISAKHANFILNLGNAKSKDVLKLMALAKNSVKRKFGIKLEEEMQYIK